MRHPTKNLDHKVFFPDGSYLLTYFDVHEDPTFGKYPMAKPVEEGFRLASERFLTCRKPQNAMVDCRDDEISPGCVFIYVGQDDDYENGTVFQIASRRDSTASEILTFTAANHFRNLSEEAESQLVKEFRDASKARRQEMLIEAEKVIQDARIKT